MFFQDQLGFEHRVSGSVGQFHNPHRTAVLIKKWGFAGDISTGVWVQIPRSTGTTTGHFGKSELFAFSEKLVVAKVTNKNRNTSKT